VLPTKIDISAIVKGHVASLRDLRTGRSSPGDVVLFVGVPFLFAGIAIWRGVQIRSTAINGILTAYSIFAGLLFNLVMLVITFLARSSTSNRRAHACGLS